MNIVRGIAVFFCVIYLDYVRHRLSAEESALDERAVLKCFPILLIAGSLVPDGLSKRSVITLLGLLFSCAGDFFLVYPGENNFLLGLINFAIAHVVYIVAFSVPCVKKTKLALPLLLPNLLFGAAMLATFYQGVPESLQIPVICYIVVISLMSWRAMARGSIRGVLGSLMFMASDYVLACGEFNAEAVNKYTEGHRGLIIMTTYYLAQWLIASDAGRETRAYFKKLNAPVADEKAKKKQQKEE